MKTVIVLEIEHRKPIPQLANMIAGRAWSIAGVSGAELLPVNGGTDRDLRDQGFTAGEIALGHTEVVRG
jgi:hypothetical protein